MRRGAIAVSSTLLFAGSLVGGSLAQSFTEGGTPLERSVIALPGMSVANMLPKGALLGYAGQQQANPDGAGGTGNQLYSLGLEAATSDRLSFGLAYDKFADPVAIAGIPDGIREMLTVGVHGKFRFFDNGRVQVAGLAAANWLRLSGSYFGANTDSYAAGALQMPVTIDVAPGLQAHVTPSVSFFPDQINGRDFYGIVPSVGVGLSYRVSQRLGFYALVNVPFAGDGNGNTIDAAGNLTNVPVWTAGASWLVTPKAQLDMFVTNGLGSTPATGILTFPLDGDEPLVGVRLSYTPGYGTEYRANYRGIRPVTERERHLQFPGLTLESADTLETGLILFSASYGTDGHYNYGARFSPDHDLEVGYHIEKLANDGSRGAARTLGRADEKRFLVSAKLRFLDQNNGSPLSLSAYLGVGREFDTRFGVAYLSAPMSYKFANGLALTAEPKFAAYGNEELAGLGLGVNYELFRGLDLIAEVTPMLGGDAMTWAAGARYSVGNASVEVQATNAAGDMAAASMLAQDEVRYSVGISYALDGKPFWKGLF